MAENKAVALHYYNKEINRDVPIRAVIEQYTGAETSQGNIRCPSPEHKDEHFSAHIYDKNGQNRCKCFSCGGNFSPVDIVMMNKGCSFGEACETLIEDFGLDMSLYSNIDEVNRSKAALGKSGSEVKETFPITVQDCEFLGFKNAFSKTIENPNYEEEIQYDANAVRYFKRPSIVEAWENDRNDIESMLTGKCDDLIDYHNELIYADEVAFKSLYSLHTNNEWSEAMKLQEAVSKIQAQSEKAMYEDTNAQAYRPIKMTERQFALIEDLSVLIDKSKTIAYHEEQVEKVKTIREKITERQAEREKAAEKKQSKSAQIQR